MPTQNDNDANLYGRSNTLRIREEDAVSVRPQYDIKTLSRQQWRAWENVPPDEAQLILKYLEHSTSVRNNETATAFVDNPVVDGQELGGRWYNATVYYDAPSKTLIQLLLEVITITTLANLTTATARIATGKEALDPFGFTEEVSSEEYLSFTWENLTPASRTVLSGFTNANLVTQLASGWTYMDRDIVEAQNGPLSFTVLFKKTAWANTNPTYHKTSVQNRGGYGQFIVETAGNVPVDTAITTVESEGTAQDISASNQGNGRATVSKVTKNGTELEVAISYQPARGSRLATASKCWFGVSPANRATRWTSAKAYSGTGELTGGSNDGAELSSVGPDGYSNVVGHAVVIPGTTGYSPYSAKTNLTTKRVRVIGKEADGTYKYYTETDTYSVDYHATKHAAFEAINGGLDGSTIHEVVNELLYESIKITQRVLSAVYDGSTGATITA